MSTVKSQFYKKFYFPDSSTACRTKLIAGTCFGSLARKRICGVLGSVSGKPSISCMLPATHENGSQSGPTSSTSSPRKLVAQTQNSVSVFVAAFHDCADLPVAQIPGAFGVLPRCPKKKPVE